MDILVLITFTTEVEFKSICYFTFYMDLCQKWSPLELWVLVLLVNLI